MLAVIVPAAGLGKRLNAGFNKAFVNIKGYPLIIHTLKNLAYCEQVHLVYVVVGPSETDQMQQLLEEYKKELSDLEFVVVAGGAERQYSVYNALKIMPAQVNMVAVHDGARPFITREIFATALATAKVEKAAITAVKSKDTVKRVKNNFVHKTLPRQELYCVQTPQIFDRTLLDTAHLHAIAEGYLGTDDASLVELLNVNIAVVPGDYKNIKITTPEDVLLAEAYMQQGQTKPQLRIGQGYDVHVLTEGRKLVLGGVTIEHELGLLGHSDADVLLHAIKDAILGACGLGDIGDHFPDSSDQYKDISSLYLLQEVGRIVAEKGFVVHNIDALIIAEKPKVAPYKSQMCENIAQALNIDLDCVNIKATTTEKLGFVGRQEGIAAQAIASVYIK